MDKDLSIHFFDEQFKRQIEAESLTLNPFEQVVLPYLKGEVLDFGCGLGLLSIAAARQDCSVHALDASATAIEHLKKRAAQECLALRAQQADLRNYALQATYDAVVSIGLLMFFDCATARRQLASLQDHLRPGGVAAVNVLIEGTTYLDMFDPGSYCLFEREVLMQAFSGWESLHLQYQDFDAPHGLRKSFATLIARKPT
ncbi:MAG: class I SAM-dependent methyltransferase [Hylemonella sp.]|nr:class I SAM-dependent methyltransferase [Hylemonella sp.]MDH5709368.1 class I SAM-dependent methyltransferase [Hylemonella sp.]